MSRSSSTLRPATVQRRRAFHLQAEGLEERKLLAAGALDTSFNTSGYLLAGPTVANAVQIDSLGNILAAGNTGGTSSDFRVVRTTPGGALDPSFGSSGSVTTNFAGQADTAQDMAILPDGRIVVVGTAGNVYAVTAKGKTTNYLNNDFGLVCYNPNGTLASGFGNGGKVTTDISANATLGTHYKEDDAYGVAVQGDGKIVVGGKSFLASGYTEGVLVRYNTNGSLDTSFGPNHDGIVHIKLPNFNGDGVWDVATLHDPNDPTHSVNDKIVTMEAPYTPDASGNYHWSVAVARYNLDGTSDTSFGTNGRTITTMQGQIDAWSMALQTDGAVVVGGDYDYQNGTPRDLVLFRYTAAGMPDPNFGSGSGGVVLFDAGGADYARSVAIQPDGKILLAGGSSTSSLASSASAIVARFTTTGAIDTTFGTSGVARNMVTNSENTYHGLAVQPDGNIVAVGSARTQVTSKTSKYDFLIARYLGDPAPLLASSIAPAPVHQSLSTAQVRPVLAQALAYWRAHGADTSHLGQIDIAIADLGGNRLGEASGSTITLDDNADGWGWNVDRAAGRGRKALSGRMDLLSAVIHEVGHLLGHDHAEGGVMAETLAPGVLQALPATSSHAFTPKISGRGKMPSRVGALSAHLHSGHLRKARS